MVAFKKLQQVKEMFIQLVQLFAVCLYSCLLYYNYFKNSYKLTGIDLSKQQALDAEPKTIQKINFTGNLAQHVTLFLIIEVAKNSFRFFTRNCKSILLLILF